MANREQVLGDPNYIPVLDYGFIGLVDHMGSDESIVQAARVSYGKGTKKVSEDRGLIRYLMRLRHTTPFEMCEVKFHCKMPIFVARQWIRHRTASVNEYSARYSEMPDEFYVPELEHIAPQSVSNNQGREGYLSEHNKKEIQDNIIYNNEFCYGLYQMLLGNEDDGGAFEMDEDNPYPGLSRELARMTLPLNNYTEWYWKMNLHNLFHFLGLRLDPHAQYEIRVYAEAIFKLIKPLYPFACEAFEDYRLNAVNFSAQERGVLDQLIELLLNVSEINEEAIQKMALSEKLSTRETQEFMKKIGMKFDD